MDEAKIRADPPAIASTERELWLLGQPPLQRYLDFVEETMVGGEKADRRLLVDEWRSANDYYSELEEREAGIADTIERRDLDPSLAPLVDEVRADPRFHRTFDTLPTEFGLIELDRLVVFQNHVTLDHVEALASRLGRDPDAKALFSFCLPLGDPEPAVQAQRVGDNRYIFRSPSTDFRFHKPVLLRPEQIVDCYTYGPIAGVVGLVVGFGSNFLNVIHDDKRYLLHNGYHRACALRALGITHAPCIIQSVTRLDELAITVRRRIRENAELYFASPRPPLLKDFFDERIRKVLQVHKIQRMIEVKFEVSDHLVRD